MLESDRSPEPDELAERYAQDGFLVVHDILSPAEIEALCADMLAICRGRHGPIDGLEAPDPSEPDEAAVRRCLVIGQLHKLSPLMLETIAHPKIVDVLTRIIGPHVKAIQSMLFTKAYGQPGVPWHQDEDVHPTRDRSLTGVWIALDDSTLENGCLWVLPGSHRPGVLYPYHDIDDDRFEFPVEMHGFPFTDDDAFPAVMPAGAAVFFNGYMLHRSLKNTAKQGFRRALVYHYMNAESLYARVIDEKVSVGLQDYRDIVMVAGTDPYAYKGIDDVATPWVRLAHGDDLAVDAEAAGYT
jgi:ectoine hydroxylase-related dioxygenase (phytanoyl-CoA dioxygenase family)